MPDIKKENVYYRLAKEFGWTPAEVDAQPAEKIDTLLTFIREIDKVNIDAGRGNKH